ncbi:hypothetical protein EVC12_092 [Rhizobium phage RHph_I42]|nr:hypothetical protein EVC12_092 [Rhizobium phage RHph_I42]
MKFGHSDDPITDYVSEVTEIGVLVDQLVTGKLNNGYRRAKLIERVNRAMDFVGISDVATSTKDRLRSYSTSVDVYLKNHAFEFLTKHEIEVLMCMHTKTPLKPPGAWISATIESLVGYGMLTPGMTANFTDYGREFIRWYDALPFQRRVQIWSNVTFGQVSLRERLFRHAEEFFELMQACDVETSDLDMIKNHVYSKPVGEIAQEAGGVSTTFHVLCATLGIDAVGVGNHELGNMWKRLHIIREKTENKIHPDHPLPGVATTG